MLVRGDQLTAAQREQVTAAFVHRPTFENPHRAISGATVFVSDDEWIRAHAFHFLRNGSRLSANHHYAVPACVASATTQL